MYSFAQLVDSLPDGFRFATPAEVEMALAEAGNLFFILVRTGNSDDADLAVRLDTPSTLG